MKIVKIILKNYESEGEVIEEGKEMVHVKDKKDGINYWIPKQDAHDTAKR